MGKYCPKSLTALVLTGALSVGATTANAECIKAVTADYDAYEAGDIKAKSTFRVNELVVLCFQAAQSGYVAVFDAPKQGDFEQLFPNALTHPGGETYTQIEGGKTYCFGGRDTFPMYHPAEEGTGIGKISIALTQSPKHQLSEDEYAIPGQRVAKSTMNLHLKSHSRSSETCSERDVFYIDYKITN